MSSIFALALGIAVVYGDSMSQKFMMSVFQFFLHVHCKLARWIADLPILHYDDNVYREFASILTTLPNSIEPHFNKYPALYTLFGWLIIIFSSSLIFHNAIVSMVHKRDA